jgi:hypothetical protein
MRMTSASTPAMTEEDEREQDVEQSDPLVIDRRHPRVKRLAPGGRSIRSAVNGHDV